MADSPSNLGKSPRERADIAAPPAGPPGPPRADGRLTAPARPNRDLLKVELDHDLRPPKNHRLSTSFLTSFAVHSILLLVLALVFGEVRLAPRTALVISPHVGDGLQPEDSPVVSVAPAGLESLESANDIVSESAETMPSIEPPDEVIQNHSSNVTDPSISAIVSEPRSLAVRVRNTSAGSFRGRTGPIREQLSGSRGGTPQSQSAVERGLAWLAAHQHRDGGWRFDLELEDGPCHGQCRDSGTVGTTTGATGLALLAFLGDGQTHTDGVYQEVVDRGIYYLRGHALKTPHGMDLQEGTMYAHGIATLALCEAYGLTQDQSLRPLAQGAVDFICYAQHSKGGWRYYPQQPGDTTVFGWQMMALKSAAMAGLTVPSPVLRLAERFLDSVQTEAGAFYGYIAPDKLPAPTAIGLLVRMYTGWDRIDSRLRRGVTYLAKLRPSQTDIYFDYYATLVLCQYGGPLWENWNRHLRDYLIATQGGAGHERGSWFFPDHHSSRAGRLYTTAMCVMILEVYYRYMPLYKRDVVEFEL